MMEGAMESHPGHFLYSEDPDILQTESNYTALESELRNELANIENTYSGYDEYRYDVDNIGHNPNELISYLTAKFDAFTPEQVQAELEAIFEKQLQSYHPCRNRNLLPHRNPNRHHHKHRPCDRGKPPPRSTPMRWRFRMSTYILYVTLRNKGFGTVAVEGLTEDEKTQYAATLSMKGNKPYLFGDDIYANESPGEDYDIPGEALADPDFAALITEAERYLGFPMSGAAPVQAPALIAAVLSVTFIPIAASITCPVPRRRAFITSAPTFLHRKQNRETLSFYRHLTILRGLSAMWESTSATI